MSAENRFPCLVPSEILVPGKGVDPETWAVIACDQYTSQPEYWKRVEQTVGDRPSSLRLILPEVWLGSPDEENRRKSIPENMRDVLRRGLLDGPSEDGVPPGFMLTERTTASGKRIGLVAALDMETYDYRPGNPLVRATEQTVPERLPPRMRIRSEACLELPHILLLADDPGRTLIEPLYERIVREGRTPRYDFSLMENGGRLCGWRIWSEDDLSLVSSALRSLEASSGGLLFAVGDGNHSLAAAKACWEERKRGGADPDEDPFRYALVEIVNLHSEAIRFSPIHRLLKGTELSALEEAFKAYLLKEGLSWEDGTEIRFSSGGKVCRGIAIRGEKKNGRLAVQILQPFLDAFLKLHLSASIDYIHGEKTLLSLTEQPDSCGVLLEGMRKEDLFPGIRAGGCLPRKTFSMGEADEKRFYFEARKLCEN